MPAVESLLIRLCTMFASLQKPYLRYEHIRDQMDMYALSSYGIQDVLLQLHGICVSCCWIPVQLL